MSLDVFNRHGPQTPKPRVLYHGTIHDVKGVIYPRANETCTKKEYAPLIFAGESKTAAYAYAIKTNQCIESHGLKHNSKPAGFYVLFEDRNTFYRENPSGTIWELDPTPFECVPRSDGNGFSSEWICRQPIPVNQEQSIPVSGIEEVMRQGVQVYFLTRQPTADEQKLMQGEPLTQRHAALIKSGLFHWENMDSNVMPSQTLLSLVKKPSRGYDPFTA